MRPDRRRDGTDRRRGCPSGRERDRRRARSVRSQRCREPALTGVSGVPQGPPKGLEGPQRAAMRPTRTVNGLRPAKLRRMTALERAIRPDRRRDGAHGGRDGPEKKSEKKVNCRLTWLPQVCEGSVSANERMRTMPDDTTQRSHRLALQEPTPEASGRSIPPIRSDLVGAADTHLAAKPPARLSSPTPPPPPRISSRGG